MYFAEIKRHLHIHSSYRMSHMLVVMSIIFSLTFIYYRWLWGSLEIFITDIDHHQQLFQDFVGHYYPMSQTILHTPIPVSGYFYSAFFALTLIPFSYLGLSTALWAWGLLQIFSLLLLYILPLRKLIRLTLWEAILYTGTFTLSFPLLHNLKWGQVSIILTACVIGAFHVHVAKKSILAGIILALATAIKYYPIIFLSYFVMKRDFRVCISFAVALTIIYMIIPSAAIGIDAWINFEQTTITAISGANWVSLDNNSQYVAHVVSRWINVLFQHSTAPSDLKIISTIGYSVFLLNMALVWILQKNDQDNNNLLALPLIFLSLPFVIKTSWPHYFCYLPFCQIAIFVYLRSIQLEFHSVGKILRLLPILSIACSSIPVFKIFPDWNSYNAYGMLFIANLLLLACVYIIIFMENKQA